MWDSVVACLICDLVAACLICDSVAACLICDSVAAFSTNRFSTMFNDFQYFQGLSTIINEFQ